MKAKPSIAIVRGKHLNQYEMQIFEPLVDRYSMTAFGSLAPFHDEFDFPTVKLPSPMDLPDFPLKMPILNRAFIDAQYLLGLEGKLKGFDIVHSAETYYHYTQQALNAKKKGYVKKVIATVLENIPFNNEGIWGRSKFKKRAREELDHIIALTERTKATLILEGADPKKITVISHGINTSRFHNDRKRDFQKRHITLLFCGRLEVYKGVYEIIYALKQLLNDTQLHKYTFSLIMVGGGSERENLIKKEISLGISTYITHKQVSYKDMPQEYQTADIYLAPSKPDTYWLEQYNTTLLEAQAAGLPIITTHSGGIPENIGNAGVLIPPNDYFQLTETIKDLVLHPNLRASLSKKARERSLTVHDTRIIADKISQVYEKVLY